MKLLYNSIIIFLLSIMSKKELYTTKVVGIVFVLFLILFPYLIINNLRLELEAERQKQKQLNLQEAYYLIATEGDYTDTKRFFGCYEN